MMQSLLSTGSKPLQSIVAVRPMLMLTGFLGAGKTTLLRHLLRELGERDHSIEVILNDRENAEIDTATIEGQAAEIAALSGSCICCDGYSDLVELILKASKSEHDALLIEVNGTADPVPLLESFTLLESKFCLRPRWQVCVLDARHFGDRGYFDDLETLQLETASHYYISWTEGLSDEELGAIEQRIRGINPNASRTNVAMLADALSEVIVKSPKRALSQNSEATRKPLSKAQAITAEQQKRHQISHEFTGCQVIIPEPVEAVDVIDWLQALPQSVMRAKALLTLHTDTSLRYLYERVGEYISPDPISGRTDSKSPCSAIFIGAELDPAEILSLSQKFLHPACHFPSS